MKHLKLHLIALRILGLPYLLFAQLLFIVAWLCVMLWEWKWIPYKINSGPGYMDLTFTEDVEQGCSWDYPKNRLIMYKVHKEWKTWYHWLFFQKYELIDTRNIKEEKEVVKMDKWRLFKEEKEVEEKKEKEKKEIISTFKEHDIVICIKDLEDSVVGSGSKGTITYVYNLTLGGLYEVEFNINGETVIEQCTADELKLA